MKTNAWYYSLFNDFNGWNPLAYGWLILGIFAVAWGSVYSSPLEAIAAITNVVCVILVAKGKASNYYWGAVGVISYAIVAYGQHLYGNMLLNIIYIGFQIWGIYEWRKSLAWKLETNDQEVIGRYLTKVGIITTLAVLLIGWLVAYMYLIKVNSSSPLLDSFTLVGSLVAMTLMVKRYNEQWLLWIAVNIASIWMWVVPSLNHEGSWAMVAMWSVFLINSLYGAYKWYFVKIGK